jgi:hypothetical protein
MTPALEGIDAFSIQPKERLCAIVKRLGAADESQALRSAQVAFPPLRLCAECRSTTLKISIALSIARPI